MTGTTGPTPRAAVCPAERGRQSGRSGPVGESAGSASTVASAWRLSLGLAERDGHAV
jgi:hypothetical protein